MTKLYLIISTLILVHPLFGQKPDEIIITSIERTDRTFSKKDKLLLENNFTKNQIIYTLDSMTQSYSTQNYLLETYFNIWDGDTVVEEELKTKHKKWSNRIDSIDSKTLLNALKTDIDTLEKAMGILHSSHHYLTVYIEVVFNQDTTKYYKTKPFGHLTPWHSNKHEAVLNPRIDKSILMLLPRKFVGRKKLKRGLSKI